MNGDIHYGISQEVITALMESSETIGRMKAGSAMAYQQQQELRSKVQQLEDLLQEANSAKEEAKREVSRVRASCADIINKQTVAHDDAVKDVIASCENTLKSWQEQHGNELKTRATATETEAIRAANRLICKRMQRAEALLRQHGIPFDD